MLRIVWLVLLVACAEHGSRPGGDDQQSGCSQPQPPGSCTCSESLGWLCTTCPFGEGREPVACSEPGASCQIENWEHGCQCGCANGWWSCSPETIGSTCPIPPDAGAAR